MNRKYDLGKEVESSADGLFEALRQEIQAGNLTINQLSIIQLGLSRIWRLISEET